MLALIKREIEDNVVLFILAVVAMVFFGVISTSMSLKMIISSNPPIGVISTGTSVRMILSTPPIGIPMPMYSIFAPLLPVAALLITLFGARQMYSDKTKKTSAFLSTLTTTRQRIFIARIIAGLLWVLIVLVPIAVADIVLLKLYPRLVPVDIGLLVRLFSISLFVCLACYALGLQLGFQNNRILSALGLILIWPVLVSTVIIKGLGLETVVILLLFIAASLVRTWQKFMAELL